MADSEDTGRGLRDPNDSNIGAADALHTEGGGTFAQNSQTGHAGSLHARGTRADAADTRIGSAYADKSEVDAGCCCNSARLEAASTVALDDCISGRRAGRHDLPIKRERAAACNR